MHNLDSLELYQDSYGFSNDFIFWFLLKKYKERTILKEWTDLIVKIGVAHISLYFTIKKL